MKKLATILMLATLSLFTVSGFTRAQGACITLGTDVDRANAVFSGVNNYRKQNGIFSLRRSTYLDKLAAHKAYEYSLTKQWAHDINGKTWIQIYQECGVTYTKLGENLARRLPDSRMVIEFWKSTPIHKANMLDLRHKQVGLFVGMPEDDYYTVAVYMN